MKTESVKKASMMMIRKSNAAVGDIFLTEIKTRVCISVCRCDFFYCSLREYQRGRITCVINYLRF